MMYRNQINTIHTLVYFMAFEGQGQIGEIYFEKKK